MRNKVLLYAPPIVEFGTSMSDVHDGELLYLGQYFFNLNYDVNVLDHYANPNKYSLEHFSPDVLIVHLWKNALIKNKNLHIVLERLVGYKLLNKKVEIILIGSIAVGLHEEILKYYKETIDAIVSSHAFYLSNKDELLIPLNVIQEYYTLPIILTDEYLSTSPVDLDENDVVSVFSSRGCRKGCSFCSYNKDISKWTKREVPSLINDINLLHKYFKVRRFGLFDNNFGNDLLINRERSELLADGINELSFSVNLSLNISLDGIDEVVLKNFRRANVDSILIGLESLNPDTLEKIYNKPTDIVKAQKMVQYAEDIGITPVISYILFQPYLTFSQLKNELRLIEMFGRYRIIQFLSRSVLIVNSGTKMEKMLKRDGLLITHDLFYRDFIFLDQKVASIYKVLQEYVNDNFRKYNTSTYKISKLKYQEWNLVKSLVDNVNS